MLKSVPLCCEGLDFGGDVVEGFRHDRVDGDHGSGDGLQGAGGAELEAVPGEGERAGAVAVAGVGGQDGEGVDADGEGAFVFAVGGAAFGDLVEDVGELVAEEDTDDGGGGFVGAEAVIVGGGGDRGA